ncbi:MAG: SMP-30/gluconolactonase/LRE family protein [Archangiaceae bacterium]|nr:SMP-30/gluconolactonase/LRE family protein [Archangiaceae bacterium]
MKKPAAVVLAALSALALYLCAWPVRYAPAVWVPPPKVPVPLNDALKTGVLLHPELQGAEAIAFDGEGRLLTGLSDGRLVRIGAGDRVETVLQSQGRALGLKYGPDGRLWICDSFLGLRALEADGGVENFETGAQFADDLDFGADGSVYFSEASRRNDVEHSVEDLIEHQTTGRLLRFHQGKTSVVAEGFAFANGVAFGPSPDWLVMTETASYRLWKIHVPDGRREVFADSLPGFPDNVTWSPKRQVFWVALGSPRNDLVEALAGLPFVRKMIFRLPKAVQPKPIRHATVLALDVEGHIVQNLQYKDPQAFSPVASAVEHDGALYLGSYLIGGYVRYALP